MLSVQKHYINIVFFFLVSAITIPLWAQTTLNTLSQKTEFDAFSNTPLTQKYGQVSAVKIVYDIKLEKLYFINGNRYQLHYDFCKKHLNYNVDLDFFNEHNYGDKGKQRYLLANINYFRSLNTYAIEIAAANQMTIPELIALHQILAKNTFMGSELKLLANTPKIRANAVKFQNKLTLLYPSEIYKNASYQPIGKYKGTGTLKFVPDLDKAIDQIDPNDIIVLKQTPLFLPVVAGILVAEFQTPLSHLTILGQNRKIPISAYTAAFNDTHLLSFEGKNIQYEVTRDTFYIRLAKPKKSKKKKKRTISLKYDLTVDSLVDCRNFKRNAYRYAGNKAANFALLQALSKEADFKTPESAFAIPFYFYQQHILQSGADSLITQLLSLPKITTQKDTLQKYLKRIRNRIKKHPLDAHLDSLVRHKITAKGSYKRMRFRSSTNAEDAKGFSGAGLYTSKTGIVDHPKKTIAKAIQKVWASLWSYEAFLERSYYNIDHTATYMGILVHRSFPNERVNGVAITKNIYRPDGQGFVINAQLGEVSVVKPEPGIISDQFICYPENTYDLYKNTVDIITTSSLNEGNLVMKATEIRDLSNSLEHIKRYFYKHTSTFKSYENFGLDVEFKIDGAQNDLYIKQVRLYND